MNWQKLTTRDEPQWEFGCKDSVAFAACGNAVVVASASEIAALNLEKGSRLWSETLPACPVPWGLAVDRDGRVVVVLEDGKVLCFGQRTVASAAQSR